MNPKQAKKNAMTMTSEEIENLVIGLYNIGYRLDKNNDASVYSGNIGQRKLGIYMLYDPTQSEKNGDPWHAALFRHVGTGQTAEMALLQLKEKVLDYLNESVASEEQRLKEIQERISFIKDVSKG